MSLTTAWRMPWPRVKRAARWLHYSRYYAHGPAPKPEYHQGEAFRFALHPPPRGARQDKETLLYFLHAAGGSERDWAEKPPARAFYAFYRRKGLSAPTVVSISAGPFWTLMETPGPKQPALFKLFMEEWMPAVEKRTGPPRRRLIWGISQGAFNAARLVLKRPELWQAAVLSSPPFMTVSIYAGPRDIDAYITRTRADRESVHWAIDNLQPLVGGPKAWRQENTQALAEIADDLPPVLVQVNPTDEFGFMEGALEFSRALARRGQPVRLSPHRGGHCVVDVPEAADFLSTRGIDKI